MIKTTDPLDFERRFLLFAEAEGEGEGGGGGGSEGGQEGAEGAAGKQEGAEGGEGKGAAEGGEKKPDATDWRAAIKDPEAKKFAESSTDIEHLTKRAMEMRQKLSSAIIKPGKDAKPEEVAAFRKALEVPETPEGYKFPEIPEGELTDAVKESRAAWAKRFHDRNVPAPVAEALMADFRADMEAEAKAQQEADKQYAEQVMEGLRKEWGADFDTNKQYANRAAAHLFGDEFDAARKIEMKDGRFLMDRPELLKVFAKIGREMGEGTLGSVMTDGDKEAAETELRSLRKQIGEAQAEGNSKRANELYQKEQALIAKMGGNRPVVGAQGRTA